MQGGQTHTPHTNIHTHRWAVIKLVVVRSVKRIFHSTLDVKDLGDD